ncbi:phosphatidylinositol glycan anchor biosynthesis class U protein-like [Varroa jacobsoni]|uniref:Phosphatidylinositol glycan anchor biosynthesis class U protein n=1 Tax=Varroa destructor TaxID=109461 RepID=A0A7M7J8W4_VARDE|nr:phosphatidylinositol glycan anchor biosynthesis class U protein-like [Varroa destructor]XP_022711809.1 phosphatidylinositol glycan anchor biosynthesis class U protein-like [Varroa jacobsoni]
MGTAVNAVFLITGGYALRLALMWSEFRGRIADRVELSTPMNSWKRVVEGYFLEKHGINPYSGDILHEPYLSLRFYSLLLTFLRSNGLVHLFIVVDLLTGLILYAASKKCVQILLHQDRSLSKAQSSRKLVLTIATARQIPTLVLTVYCLSPFNILSCVSQNTSIFDNLLHTLSLLAMVYGAWPLSTVTLALLTSRCLHTVILVVPAVLFIRHRTPCILFLSAYTAILAQLMSFNSDSHISAYYFQLAVTDLTPNVGLFWYFFTELFDHFRWFFLCVFHLNVFIYVAPLAIKLRKDPLLLYWTLIVTVSVFKPYPSLADFAFYSSLLPIFRHLFDLMRQVIVVFTAIALCLVLTPIMWQQWIFAYSGNANFYFAMTLLYNVAQVFLLTDLLVSDMKRKFYLQHGDAKEFEAKKLKLTLE